jgi:hypothetical protein
VYVCVCVWVSVGVCGCVYVCIVLVCVCVWCGFVCGCGCVWVCFSMCVGVCMCVGGCGCVCGCGCVYLTVGFVDLMLMNKKLNPRHFKSDTHRRIGKSWGSIFYPVTEVKSFTFCVILDSKGFCDTYIIHKL